MADDAPILCPRDTCWRIEHAGRMAVIVDAADCSATVTQAILVTRHTVLLIAWDVGARIWLDPRGKAPDRLRSPLSWMAKRNPALQIRVPKCDPGTVKPLGRGTTPLFVPDGLTDARIRFRLDGAHPRALVHHQKMVVIDDALAVCGGIDMTADRRDTRDRLVGDDRLFRVGASNPNNRSMGGDAEGKLSIKAGPGNAALSDRIVTLRDDPSGGLAIPRATF